MPHAKPVAISIGLGVYLLLILFGLYQAKAHNRAWGTKLVGWASLLVLFAGIGVKHKSIILAVVLAVTLVLLMIGWIVIGRVSKGWKCHLSRAILSGVLLGPMLALPYRLIRSGFDAWVKEELLKLPAEALTRFLWGVPGFILAGVAAYAISAVGGWMEQTTTFRQRLPRWGVLVVVLVGINWYAAGVFHPNDIARFLSLNYFAWSRPGVLQIRSTAGDAPLHEALVCEDPETVVKALLNAGAEIDVRDRVGRTPLLMTCSGDFDLGLIRLLLDRGADVTARDDQGNTILHLCFMHWWSTAEGVIKLAVKHGVDVNAVNAHEETPLLIAATRGAPEEVKLLLEAGAKVNISSKSGTTPLHASLLARRAGGTKTLLEAGADPKAKDCAGLTPLHWAVQRYNEKSLSTLLEHGADPNAKDTLGQTPLHLAVSTSYTEMISPLLKAGADPKIGDKSGLTPLHLAAAECFSAGAKMMLKAGAPVNILDSSGRTPLDCVPAQSLRRMYDVMDDPKLKAGEDPVRDAIVQLLVVHGGKKASVLTKQGEGDEEITKPGAPSLWIPDDEE